MRSDVRLYCHAHRFAPVGFLLVVAGLLVIAAGTTIVSVPWLSGSQTINVATLCALAWPVACTLIFRNELSRLEAFGARAWAWADAGVLCILWALPWLLAVSSLASARFAYVSTVLAGLAVTLGQFLRVDTLALALVACVVAQTALWPALDTSALRHALFILDEPPRWFMVAVSALMLGASCVSVNRFKKAA